MCQLVALESIGSAQTEPQGAIEGDVKGPGQRSGKPGSGKNAPERQRGQNDRTDEAMQDVVDRNRARGQLPFFRFSARSRDET